mgnify:CR=1 FL=1
MPAILATDLALRALSPGGALLTKVFQGEGFEAWFHQIRDRFERVVTRKPAASRPRSREVYVVQKESLIFFQDPS